MAAVTPRSVAFLNRLALFGKLSLGTLFQSWVTNIRDFHDVITNLHSVVTDLRAVLVEKTDFQCLGHAGVQQNTGAGGNTDIEIATAFDYMIDGKIYTKGTEQDINVGAATTTAGQYRAITLCINSAGTVSQVITPVAAAAPVTPLPPTANTCAFATVQIPASFTPGTTAFTTAWVTHGWQEQDAPSVALTSTVAATKPAVLPDKDV